MQGVDGMGILFERLCLFREGGNTFQSATVNLSLSISEMHEQRFQSNDGEKGQDSVSTRLRVILRLLGWQVQFSRLLGNLQAAKNCLDRGLQILGEVEQQGINFLFEKATLLHQKGLLEYLHDRSQAQQDLFDCIELYGRIGNDWRKAQALINLSQTTSALGDYEQARVLLDESLRLSRHLGDQIGIAGTLKELSSLESAEFGNLDRAFDLINQRMSILKDIDNSVDIAENFSTLFVCEIYRGRFEEGIKLGKEALRIYEHLGMHSSVLILSELLCWGEVNLGRYEKPFEKYQEYLAISKERDNFFGIVLGLLGLAGLLLVRGEYVEAREILEEGVIYYQQVHQADEYCIVLCFFSYAEFYLSLRENAHSHFQQAGEIAVKIHSWQAALSYLEIGALLLAECGQIEKGIELYALATRYPYLGNSLFRFDLTGKRIAELSASLPESVVRIAQGRGRQKDLHKAVEELDGLDFGIISPDSYSF
jgi:tetratricopeptide (TPR) repeat protein